MRDAAAPVLPPEPTAPGGIDLSHGGTFGSGFPHGVFRWLREHEPLWWHPPSARTPDGEGFWVVSRYADIAAILRRPGLYSSHRGGERPWGGTAIRDERSAGHMLNQTDDPLHRRLRALVQKGFTTRNIATLEGTVRERAARLLDAAEAAHHDVRGVDFVAGFARELPLQVICDILGVPEEDRRTLAAWVDEGLENDAGDPIGHEALRRIARYAEGLIARRRRQPGPDIFSVIVHARLEDHETPRLTDRELKLFFNLLFPAGAETTRSALAGAVLAFAEHPEQYERLRARPALLPLATEEIVRWTTPSVYKRRTVTADHELLGKTLRAGEKITLWEMSANRDEREFESPFRFDVGREPNRHLGFGAGVHFCLGSQLARLEIRVVLESLLERYRGFELAGPPRWVPNNRLLGLSALPVRLLPR